MQAWLPVLVSGMTAVLLLYVGLVMRQFARSVERLERVTESLSRTMSNTAERIARVEAVLERK